MAGEADGPIHRSAQAATLNPTSGPSAMRPQRETVDLVEATGDRGVERGDAQAGDDADDRGEQNDFAGSATEIQ